MCFVFVVVWIRGYLKFAENFFGAILAVVRAGDFLFQVKCGLRVSVNLCVCVVVVLATHI